MIDSSLDVERVPSAAQTAQPALGPPPDWTGTDARSGGWVIIPDHVDATNPCRVYELDDPAQRKYVYEIVLTDGTPADINQLIDHTLLAEMWDRLYLPHDIRVAWRHTLRALG